MTGLTGDLETQATLGRHYLVQELGGVEVVEMLIAHYCEGMSYRQIAVRFDMPLITAHAQIKRAIAELDLLRSKLGVDLVMPQDWPGVAGPS